MQITGADHPALTDVEVLVATSAQELTLALQRAPRHIELQGHIDLREIVPKPKFGPRSVFGPAIVVRSHLDISNRTAARQLTSLTVRALAS